MSVKKSKNGFVDCPDISRTGSHEPVRTPSIPSLVETQRAGFSFGLVSRLLENRFQFRFQLCLRTASVSGFQFRFKFHPRKLLYFEYGLFKRSTSWHFCFITMISSSSYGQVRRAIASEVVDLGIIPSPVKPKTQKLVFTASIFDAQQKL